MKKILMSLLLAFVLVSLTACGSTNEPSNTESGNGSIENGENSNVSTNTSDELETPASTISLEAVMNAPSSPESDFFCDEDKDGNLVLIEYLGNDEIVSIPSSINGKPITIIGQLVFANDCSVKGIKIADSVKEINKGAFGNNKNLQVVVCGNAVQKIAEATFQGCSNLQTVVLNESLNEIGKLAFAYCVGIKEIKIPQSVTEIDNSFFGSSGELTIIGEGGSAAEQYAKEAGINFQIG